MTVASTNAVGTATNGQSKTTTLGNTLDKDDFLKLLLTELRYQDSTNPMQDKEFIAQMAQITSLEQMQNLNNTMSQYFMMNSLSNGMNLLGKEVSYTTDDKAYTGVVSALKQSNGQFVALVGEQEVSLQQITQVK